MSQAPPVKLVARYKQFRCLDCNETWWQKVDSRGRRVGEPITEAEMDAFVLAHPPCEHVAHLPGVAIPTHIAQPLPIVTPHYAAPKQPHTRKERRVAARRK